MAKMCIEQTAKGKRKMNMKIKGSVLEDGERYILKGYDHAKGKPIYFDIIFRLRKDDFHVIMINSGKDCKEEEMYYLDLIDNKSDRDRLERFLDEVIDEILTDKKSGK